MSNGDSALESWESGNSELSANSAQRGRVARSTNYTRYCQSTHTDHQTTTRKLMKIYRNKA